VNPESRIFNAVRLACSRVATLWRNNVGVARYRTRDGREQRVVYGLCPGSADAIGIMPVVIRPHHVGQVVGIFVAIETKTARGRPADAQVLFLNHVAEQGGIAIIAREPDGTRRILEQVREGSEPWGVLHGVVSGARGPQEQPVRPPER
jgi:hypothetical protein